jgi:hypothetical protein
MILKTVRFAVPTAAIILMSIAASFVAADSGVPDRVMNAEKRAAIVEKVVEQLNEYYIDPEMAAKLEEHLRQELSEGRYDDFGELQPFVRQLTADLREVSNDLHLGVWPIEYAILTDDTSEEDRARLVAIARYDNYGISTVQRLPGNIGYLELRYFEGPDIAGPTAVAAMNTLANSDALIIDVRRNGGGDGSLVLLFLSFLFDEPVHTLDVFSRLDGSTEQSWTFAYVPGPRLGNMPVYVLQSRRSASAAEDLSYVLKTTGRATLVGETTKGAANPVEEFVFPELSICMAVSAYRVTSPITGTCWEGVGVGPDVEVDAVDALYAAGAEAMKNLLAGDGDPEIERGRRWALELYEARRNHVTLTDREMESYVGQFGGGVLVKSARGRLSLERTRRMPLTLIPLGDDSFTCEETEARVTFKRNSGGAITALVFEARNGGKTDYEKSDG